MMGRLLRLQWLALLVVGLTGGGVSFVLTWESIQQAHNHTLEQVAQSVVRHGLTNEDDNLPDPEDQGEFISQIWTQDGKLYFSSMETGGPPRQSVGWHRLEWGQQLWDIYTLEEDGLTIQVSQPGQTRAQVLWAATPWVLGTLLVLSTGLFVMLWLAAKWSLQPLQHLQRSLHPSQPFNSAPDLSHTVWPPELAPLVRTLDHLFADLQAARQAQTQWVARAAHEFRTPLAALRLHVQLLTRQTDPEQGQRHQRHVLDSIDRMTRLVNQLLQLAQLDALHHTEGQVWFAVDDWWQTHASLLTALAQGHGVVLHWVSAPGLCWCGQPHALYAALDNLVHNAIRHSPNEATVQIHAMSTSGHARLGIIDHGPGLSPEQQADVGQGFQGTHHAPNDNRSGLGLAIVRRVMALHEGRLSLETTSGGGVSAWLTWPLSSKPPALPFSMASVEIK